MIQTDIDQNKQKISKNKKKKKKKTGSVQKNNVTFKANKFKIMKIISFAFNHLYRFYFNSLCGQRPVVIPNTSKRHKRTKKKANIKYSFKLCEKTFSKQLKP